MKTVTAAKPTIKTQTNVNGHATLPAPKSVIFPTYATHCGLYLATATFSLNSALSDDSYYRDG